MIDKADKFRIFEKNVKIMEFFFTRKIFENAFFQIFPLDIRKN